MWKTIGCLILFFGIVFGQIKNPSTGVDRTITRGDHSILTWRIKDNLENHEFLFVVKSSKEPSANRLIQKGNYSTYSGLTASYQNNVTTITDTIYATETNNWQSGNYFYDIWDNTDSATIVSGLFTVNPDVGTPFDGIDVSQLRIYTVALDTPIANNVFPVGMDSNNVWYQKNVAQVRSILGVDTTGGTSASLDSLYTKTSHIVNVMDYVASYDTTNGWQDAINAAIDDITPTASIRALGFGNNATEVILPAMRMALQSPILLYSGITLKGQGASSELVEDTGFQGRQLIELSGVAGDWDSVYIDNAKIKDIQLTTTTVRGIGCGTTLLDVVNCIIEGITLNAVQGIVLDEYTQFTVIRDIYSYGYVDTLLFLYGNANYVVNVDKEGNTGSSVGAYIYVKDPNGLINCGGNELHNILIEGGTSANKSAMILTETSGTVIRNFWFEPTNTDGYSIRFEGGDRIQIRGYYFFWLPTTKIKVDSVEFLDIEVATMSAEKVTDQIEKDSLSTVRVNLLSMDQALYSPYKLNDLKNGFIFGDVFTKSTIGTGISTIYKPQFYGTNWFPETFSSDLLSFSPNDLDSLVLWYEGDYGLTTSTWLNKIHSGTLQTTTSQILSPTTTDTVLFLWTSEDRVIDSINFVIDDSIAINTDGTIFFAAADTIISSEIITSFSDNTVPANSTVRLYFTFIGDGVTSVSWKIYWHEESESDADYITFYNSPTLSSTNGIPTVVFNGVDEHGTTDTLDINQPTTVYMVWEHITYDSTKIEHILDGISTLTQASFFASAGAYAVNAGSQIGVAGIKLGTFNITKIEYDSSNSVVAIDDGAEWGGNAGGNDMDGLALAHGIDTSYCNMEVAAILVYNKILSDYEDNLIIDYLSNKYDTKTSVWGYATTPDTAESLPSGVSDGNMTRLVWNSAPTNNQVFRTFVIDTAKVGQQLTFSIYCKVDTGATLASPYVSGCGITPNLNMRTYDNGWYILTETFTPTSVGTLTVGLWFWGVSEAYIDEPYLTTTVR